jgi:hypothetical protein
VPENEVDLEEYRSWLRAYPDAEWARHADLLDRELRDAIAATVKRVGDRRLSWRIMTAEMLDAR